MGSVTIKQGAMIAAGLMVAAGLAVMVPPAGPGAFDILRVPFPSLGFLHGGVVLTQVLTFLIVMVPVWIVAQPRQPGADHGASAWLRYRFRPRQLAGSDMTDYTGGNVIIEGDMARVYGEHVAMWAVPSVPMRLADESAIEAERARWAAFLNGIPCKIQTTVRATPVDMSGTIAAMVTRGTAPATNLVAHLRARNATSNLLERHRYLTIRNADEAALQRHAGQITESLARARLKSERLKDDELRAALTAGWSSSGKRPRVLHEQPYAVQLDTTWHSTVALQTWPERVRTDFLSDLIDGDKAVDFHQVIERLDRAKQRDAMNTLKFRLENTKQTKTRKRAVKQLDDVLEGLEGADNIFRVALYATVRARSQAEAEAAMHEAGRVMLEFDGTPGPLRWEQTDGALLASGTLEDKLTHRDHRVDTASISRAYPWSASELSVEGGVPWGKGLHGNRWVAWQPWARRSGIANPNVAAYGGSGSGKGFGVKVQTSRLLCAGQLDQLFALDQAEEDEDGEYGRWARYCGGEVRKVSRETWKADLARHLADIASGARIPPAIALNIAELGTPERCAAMVAFKQAIFKRAAKRRMRYGLVVDEMWSFAENKAAAAECADLARRGRHLSINTWFVTQRAQDALSSDLGKIVQGLCATQLFLMQKPSEITEIAKRLLWTPEQTATVAGLGIGQVMIEAGRTRVVFEVDWSRDEWDMANTDPILDSVLYADEDDRSDPPDSLDGEPVLSDAGAGSGSRARSLATDEARHPTGPPLTTAP